MPYSCCGSIALNLSSGSPYVACRQAFALAGRRVRSAARRPKRLALPAFIPPQLSQPVKKPPSGPQWLHEIKLDGFRMAARVELAARNS